MTTGTDERQTLAQLAQEQDWRHRVSSDQRADIFNRRDVRIRAMWQEDKLNGATLFHDEMYESYTRDVKTLRAWFKR